MLVKSGGAYKKAPAQAREPYQQSKLAETSRRLLFNFSTRKAQLSPTLKNEV